MSRIVLLNGAEAVRPWEWDCDDLEEVREEWGLHDAVLSSLTTLALDVRASMDSDLYIVSGHRSCAEQLALVGRGGPAFAPARSLHTRFPSPAVDIGFDREPDIREWSRIDAIGRCLTPQLIRPFPATDPKHLQAPELVSASQPTCE